MNKYKLLIEKNNLKVNKVTIKGKATIIDTPLGKFVLKDNKGIKIYDYLLSRGFNYFPNIIDYDSEGVIFEYIDNIDYDINLKSKDFIKLLSLLHVKTSCFLDKNDYEMIFDSLNKKIDDLYNYYNSLVDNIESKEFTSPSEYLLLRNTSIILSSINYSKEKLKEWYDKNSNNKKRVVTLYNNIDLNNLLKSKDKMCLISFDNVIVDSPIYDLYNFYNKYYLFIDFYSLLNVYENHFPLLDSKIELLLILISIPEKIIIKDNTISNFIDINNKIIKIYKSLDILNLKEEKRSNTHENKDNK